jgi:pimeloyl-ACP methyl ester carboxylesterase
MEWPLDGGERFMKIMEIALGLLLPLVSFAAPGGSPYSSDDHIRSSTNRNRIPISAPHRPDALVPGIFQQSIDHFGLESGLTFGQRYWVDSQYASKSPDAPVIFHICGEGDAEQGYFLNDNATAWAKTLGAHLVYLEHRYYGKSLLFSDLSTDHLQYLTLGNVIEDLASFQKWITIQQGWKGKWISVGGSYSGTISAIYRQKHPELVVGALASSAPMISGVGVSEGTQDDVDGLSSTDPSGDTGERQWVYQSCTTFGFWEADGPEAGATLMEPSSWLCQQLFGNVGLVNAMTYNQNYDAPFISRASGSPSNILFTYGSDDVWTAIGLAQQTNLNSGISILTINGAGHHFDLNLPTGSDSSEVLSARARFVTLAQQWLSSSR